MLLPLLFLVQWCFFFVAKFATAAVAVADVTRLECSASGLALLLAGCLKLVLDLLYR